MLFRSFTSIETIILIMEKNKSESELVKQYWSSLAERLNRNSEVAGRVSTTVSSGLE